MNAQGVGCLGSIVLLLAGSIFGATYCGSSGALEGLAGGLVVVGGLLAGAAADALWSNLRLALRVALGLAVASVSVGAVGLFTIFANIDHCGLF